MKLSRRGWLMLALLVGASAFSLVACVGLWGVARGRYRQELLVRLDPTSASRFMAANEALGPRMPGQRRVVLFGDSRVEKWGPPLVIDGAEVVNQGSSGETTAQGLLRVARDVVALQPEVVVVQYGINDLKAIGVLPEREREVVEGCAARLEAIVRRIRQECGATVVVLTVYPVGKLPITRRMVWSDRTLAAVEEVNKRLRALEDDGVVVVDCDPVLGRESRMKAEYAMDDLHLLPAGYKALNERLIPVVRLELEKRSSRENEIN